MMLRRGQPKTPVTSWSHSDGRKTKGYDVKDDIQKTSNATLDATNHSFERVTKATQAIVSEHCGLLEAFIRDRRQNDGESIWR
jgi:hypothetical protein